MQSQVLSFGKPHIPWRTIGHRLCFGRARRQTKSPVLALVGFFAFLILGAGQAGAADPRKDGVELSAEALASIDALQQAKASRSPVHRKLDSQLIYALGERGVPNGKSAHPYHRARLRSFEQGQVLLDLRADVTPEVLKFVQDEGGSVISSVPELRSLRIRLPLNSIEKLASRPEVSRVRPAVEAATNAGSVESEGGITHGATSFRDKFHVDGAGVKVGVLSDSVDFLSNVTQSGDLPAITVLPGQEGLGSGEGTAMLEIVHDVAPGADLYFATAFSGDASFAQNIRALYAAGCRIIIDDITYFNEPPFQDGIISQAVRDVCDGGALYFSSAGNSGNKSDNSAGTWEGDFVDGGAATLGRGGRLHSFGANTFNTVLSGGGYRRLDMFWSDPLGKSTNDYDVYVLDSAGRVVASSTNIQDGNDDPYENIGSLNLGDRIVIVKQKGVSRYLHLSTGRARLAVSTGGNVRGHNAASATNAFSVAASWVGASPKLFTPSTVSQVEIFSSDGPRRMFYDAAGNPLTPGDFSSTGGQVLNKPDITAADGVSTATPDFRPFFGTSAAAPHAGAIAALIWSYNPLLTPAQVREAMLTTALDIETPGLDSSSGYGVVMPEAAVASVLQPAPRLALDTVQLQDSNENGHLDANECGELTFALRNLLATTGAQATGVAATLVSLDPEVVVDPTPQLFPDLAPQVRGLNAIPFRISTKEFPSCDRPLLFELHVSADGIPPAVFPFQLETQSPGDTTPEIRTAGDVPMPLADVAETVSTIAVSGLPSPIARVDVEFHILHTYLSDLVLELSGPDGTTVLLAANQGGNGSDYGTSCAAPTRLSDAATSRLGSSSPPFVGVFRAEGSLGAFRGKSGIEANGNWTLKVRDIAENDVGVLVCWSLDFRLVSCERGPGRCLVPPSISQQPADLLRVAGQSAAFSVQAEGTDPLSYQWSKDGQEIPGAQGPELNLGSVAPSAAGHYSVRITNAYGDIESQLARLDVVTLPQITGEPQDRTVPAGDAATFQVAATGTGPLTYHWFRGELPLEGRTNDTLVIPSVASSDAGQYRARVSSPYGEAFSVFATLTVIAPPTISLMPSDLIVTNGDAASFLVEAAGTPPLTFFWFKGHSEWIPTAVDSTLLLPATTLADAGFYSVVVSNLAGVVSSRSALLEVLQAAQFVVSPTNQVLPLHGVAELVSLAIGVPPPVYQWYRSVGDGFEAIDAATNAHLLLSSLQLSDSGQYRVTASNLLASATSEVAQIQVLGLPLITTQPQSVKVVAGSAPAFEVQVSGEGPFTYQWFFNTTTPLDGQTQPRLALGQVGPEAAGGYHVVVSNRVGAVSSLPAILEIGSPVVIITHPASQEKVVGGDVVFQVDVTGDAPLAFQWYYNATPLIPEATTDTLQLSQLSFEQAGDYQVVIANFAGSVTSLVARLDVLQPPLIETGPVSQSVNLGSVLELNGIVQGAQPLDYRWIFNESEVIPGAAGPTLRIEVVEASAEGLYSLEVSNRVGTTRSAPATIRVVRPPRIDEIVGERTIALGGQLELRALISGTAPFEMQWLRGDLPIPGQTSEALVIPEAQFEDTGSYRISVKNQAGTTLSEPLAVSVLQAPVITVPPQPQLLAVGQDLIWVATAIGAEPLTYWWVYNTNEVLVGQTSPSLSIPGIQSSQAGTYQLVVSNAVGIAHSAHVLVRVHEPPTIVTQPEDLTIPRGQLARLAVHAEGSAPLRFQWYLEAGSPVDEATNSVLQISNVSSNQAGGYRVVVANDVGSVTSKVAIIQVKEVPLLVTQPADQVVVEGANALFSVTALSSTEMRFQWSFNGIFSLPDQTNATLILSNVTSSLEGDYSVEVTNDEGSVLSSRAKLRVIVAPALISQPEDVILAVGGTASFKAELSGSSPLDFQWFTDQAVPVSDATNSVLEVGPLALSDSAGYFLVASNLAGAVTSRVATVTVLEPPTIVGQPESIRIVLGTTARFFVSAQGHAPLFYQWFGPDDQPIQGAEQPELQILSAPAAATGFYSVQISNRVGVATSIPAKLEVITPPAVELVSKDMLAPIGGEVVLAALASGSQPLTYQWYYFLTNPLPDATNASLTLSNLAETNSGIYQVLVANAAGTVLSVEATLRVVPPPRILSQPLAISVGQGMTAQFEVTAEGFEPLSYQWLGPDGQPIQGATDRRFDLPTVLPKDAGGYSVWVSNAVGVVISDQALLSVVVPPEFVIHPVGQTVAVGATVTLQAEVSGTEPITFEWYFEGTKLPVQPNSRVLTLENVSTAMSGRYSVDAQNLAGTVSSSPALLSVLEPPVITRAPLSITVNQGQPAAFDVIAAGAEPLDYQWYGPGNVLLAGEISPALSLSTVQTSQAGIYSVRVRNVVGEVFSEGAQLSVIEPPVILVPPADLLAARGGEALLSVNAGGTEPLSYVWFYQETNVIADATNATLRLENLRLDQTGKYSVSVSNAAGVATSPQALLTVLEPPSIVRQPYSFRVLGGHPARFDVEAVGEQPLTYQWFGPDLSPVPGANDRILEFNAVTAADAGLYHVEVRNAVGVALSDRVTLDVVSAPLVKSQPVPLLAALGDAAELHVVAVGSEPLYYQWLLFATNVILDATNSSLRWAAADYTNAGLYSVLVSNEFGFVMSQEVEVQVLEKPSIRSVSPGLAVVAGQGAVLEAEVDGDEPLTLQWFKEGGLPVPGATSQTLEFAAVSPLDAGYYYLRVENPVGTAESAPVLLEVWVPPFVTIPPRPLVVAVGTSAEFQVVAGGTDPISYQWFRDGIILLADQTNRLLTLTETTFESAGNYSVQLSNIAGVITSEPAQLRVLERPVILRSPVSLTVATGAVVRLDVEVGGSAPFSFQWYTDGGVPIPGATEASFNLPAAEVSDSGRYFVEVGNEVGVVSSAAATLLVLQPPFLISQPGDLTVASGSNVELRAEIAGDPELHIQWYLSGTNPISGAVTNPLILPAVSVSDSGSYHLSVSNAVGGVISLPVALTVLDPPLIDTLPKSLTVLEGEDAVFEVVAQGSLLQYQWFKDGTIPIAGGTNRSLVIGKAGLADVANYSVVISNAVGVAASTAASLRVLISAQIVSFSYDGNVAAISFYSHKSLRYTLENNDQLVGAGWRVSSGSLRRKGTDSVITLYDVPGEDAAYRFYRILVE